MNVLVFKTNILNQRMVEYLSPLLAEHPEIINWSVDTEDVDKVLRIETNLDVSETEIIELVNAAGIACEVLKD
ncbi:MAG: hypothetical protein HUJ25_14035 [Crocinitomicaceae bacterium]|nr:hypothetical protein [Crocinitomicaceae bacterium]